MYLKTLEIMGFKSFPDRTKITFGEGMTAIVGPNGSGKSNISDAIRWVLGEQSTKALRGSKMEDVIFNGTEKRAPMGFAEVTLTIDNRDGRFAVDYDEIAVTRRYYRSGDSDFYINKKQVRLKDIHELFMDTGLGRDGYAMVGQGRIDEILSQKSEDRREIFEEASGISKYRYRKEEAQRKLASTEENLVRLRDIIGEMETRVEPLARQAEKAKKFLLIRDELRELEIDRWMEEADRIREKGVKAAGDLEIVRFQLEEGKASLEHLYAESEQRTEQFRSNEESTQKLRDALADAERQAAELRSASALLDSEARHSEETAKRARTEMEAGESRKTEVAGEIETLKNALDGAKKIREETENAIRIASAQAAELLRSAGDINGQIDALRAQETELRTRAGVATTDAASGEASRNALRERADAAMKAAEETSVRMTNVETEIREKKALTEENRKNLEEVRNILNGHGIRIAQKEKKLNELSEAENDLRVQKETLLEKQRLLSAMEREFEGYSKGVRLVMYETEKGKLPGIFGTVGSLIRVPDAYTVCIEAVLGSALQNIVTSDENAAKGGMMLLKHTDAGRATFLPVSVIRGKALDAKDVDKKQGFVGVASDLVTCDKKYKEIISNLLGHTVVVDQIDTAISVARAYQHSFRIVTLDGQIVNAGGAMTGGSSVKGAGILSRANDLKKTEQRLSETEQKLADTVAARTEAKQAYDLAVYELDVARAEQRTLEDGLLSLDSNLTQLQILLEGLTGERDRLRREATECEEKINYLLDSDGQLKEEIRRLNEDADALNKKIAELMQGRADAALVQNGISEQMQILQEKLYKDSAEESELNARLSELSSLMNLLGEDREKQMASIARAQQEQAELKLRAEQKEKEYLDFSAGLEKRREEIRKSDGDRMELERLRTESEKKIREKSDEVTRLEGQCIRLEGLKNAADEEEKQLSDRLWENYELTIGEAAEMRRPIENMQETVSRIAKLKNQRKALGEVNINAVEEYDELKARYDTNCAQRDDVEKARDDLNKIIDEITGEMKTIFMDHFYRINEEFKVTFHDMFGGGHAELILEDPNDVLNCGIEIKAQPPGKSFKAISLLSGGEKAFVAIALHFAILKVHPTTFCLLDEIESALDEANVSRFARYVRRMSKNIQFILISHRRGTMEESDILYGVTQQQGVTKVLTLDMEKAVREFNLK